MIQKVLKKILSWLFDSGNNEVFAKAINDIENEIIQNNKVMKANEVPEKIYVSNYSSGLTYNWHNERLAVNDIEYVKKDVFIEKACEFWKDHLAGYDICEDDIERSVESFKLAMKL